MKFNIRQELFDKEGYFLEEEVEFFRENLLKRFVMSPEGQSVLTDGEVDWTDLFLDILINRMGVELHFVWDYDMRDILYNLIPRHTIMEEDDVPMLVAELKAFFQFLKREFSFRNADSCLKILNQKTLVSRIQKELRDIENFSPTKMIFSQMIEAGIDIGDETAVQAWIETYNARIAESMKPPPVTEKAKQKYEQVKLLIEQVCTDHLNTEYSEVSLRLLDNFLTVYPDYLERGQAKSWAAAIVYAIGRVNFLFDKNTEPYLSAVELCQKFNVSQGNASQKSSQLFDLFDLMQLHPDWTLPSMVDRNPLVWMMMVDGFMMDIRHAPREVQVVAYEQGLIPYIPADKE